MEFSILSEIIGELGGILPGARVDKVIAVANDRIALLLHQKNKNYWLLLAAEHNLSRIHLLSRKPAVAASSSLFYLLLKKYLHGSRLTTIGVVNRDRIVEMRFSRIAGEVVLFFEVFGASSNLVLADAERRIIAVLRAVPPGEKVARPLVPGIVYELPALRQHGTRRTETSFDLSTLSESAGAFPVNWAVEELFERIIAERERSAVKQSLLTAVRKAAARTSRRCEAVQGDLASAEKGDDYRRMGELILGNLAGIERGQTRASLPDRLGMMHSVVLDPSRSPAENAEKYFRKYKKAKAGLAVLRERLSGAEMELAWLRGMQRDVEAAVAFEELEVFRNTLVKHGVAGGPAQKNGRPAVPSPPYRTFTYQGWDILVGRSAAGNDYVTMHLARPDDLWLHAEGMPGSHVLVRNPGKRDIPDAVIRRAASLAAYYSKGRGASKVPVAFTPAKNVGKPKGAAPGLVVLRERKSFMAMPEPE